VTGRLEILDPVKYYRANNSYFMLTGDSYAMLTTLCISTLRYVHDMPQFFLRSSYEKGTPHCRFRRKPVAVGAGRIQLYVIGITLLSCGIEPTHKFRFDRNTVLLHPPMERYMHDMPQYLCCTSTSYLGILIGLTAAYETHIL
jgi:hypothetical protein